MTDKEDKEIAKINACLPKEWGMADNTQAAEDKAAAEPKSTWTTILDGVEKVISFVCNFKDNIKSLFARRVRRQMRRNKYRMFVQTKMARYRKSMWFWDGIVKAVSDTFGAVVDWAKKKWDEVKKFASEVVTNLKMFWENLKAKVKAFLNSDFVKFVKQVYDCASKLKDVATAFIAVIKGAVERVGQIATIAAGNIPALAKLLIDLICNFSDFRAAFNYLADAVNDKNVLTRYSGYGKFFGKLLKALTTKLRRYYLQ
jgi:phage-related protein